MRRIMYVENKSHGLDGEGRIGWVEFTRSGRTFVYRGRQLAKTKGGYKYNCIDTESGEQYWVSGPRRDGADKLYGGDVRIDDDARVEYWTRIRGRPDLVERTQYRAGAATRNAGARLRKKPRVRKRR